jgi:hypothetical protein
MLLLSNFCGDIMEELMDTHSEQELIARIALYHQKTKKGRKPKKAIKCYPMKGIFWNSMGLKTQRSICS